jgi:hypothetical protein
MNYNSFHFECGSNDGRPGFIIAFGNFEGTYYRYTKRHKAARNGAPPAGKWLRRE